MKKEILKGSVSVNGEIAKKAERKVDTEKDEIIFKGEKIFYAGYEYFMLNKPAGVVSATEDKKERTVIDLIKESKRKDLFPAGRLDKDTEGLLLITNDGQLAHRLLSPKKHVDKTYFAVTEGKVVPVCSAQARSSRACAMVCCSAAWPLLTRISPTRSSKMAASTLSGSA